MQQHQLKRTYPNKAGKRVGRGGRRGKTSGRGTKGQRARAGHRIRPELRDIIKKLPKLRGHGKNRARGVNSSIVKPTIINIREITRIYSDGAVVSPSTLVSNGLLKTRAGYLPDVKILAVGVPTKRFIISGCLVSASAKAKIEKAGGEIRAR